MKIDPNGDDLLSGGASGGPVLTTDPDIGIEGQNEAVTVTAGLSLEYALIQDSTHLNAVAVILQLCRRITALTNRIDVLEAKVNG